MIDQFCLMGSGVSVHRHWLLLWTSEGVDILAGSIWERTLLVSDGADGEPTSRFQGPSVINTTSSQQPSAEDQAFNITFLGHCKIQTIKYILSLKFNSKGSNYYTFSVLYTEKARDQVICSMLRDQVPESMILSCS